MNKIFSLSYIIMAKTITPLFARVVVEPIAEEEVRSSGIVLPDTVSKDRPKEGKIISVGPNCKSVKAGDIILFKQYSPTEVKLDGAEYLILDEEDILGTVQG